MLYNQVIPSKKFVLTEQKQREISVLYPSLFAFFNDGFTKKWFSVVPSVMKDLPNLTGKCEIRIFRTDMVIDMNGVLHVDKMYEHYIIKAVIKYPYIIALKHHSQGHIPDEMLALYLKKLRCLSTFNHYYDYTKLAKMNRRTLKYITYFDIEENKYRFPKLLYMRIIQIANNSIDDNITYYKFPLLLTLEARNGQPYEHIVVTNNNKKINAFVTVLLYMRYLGIPKDILRLIGRLSSRLSSEYWENKPVKTKKLKVDYE